METEKGAAQVTVELAKGKLIVRHCEGGVVLVDRPLPLGGWDEIFKVLEGPEGVKL